MSEIEIGSVWREKTDGTERHVVIVEDEVVWVKRHGMNGRVWIGKPDFLARFEPKADMVNEQAAPFASWDFGTADKTVTCEFYAIDEQAKPERRHSHYFIDVSDLEFIDVYHLCKRAKIQDESGATHHALKKLLFSGKRGSKDRIKDLQEAADTILRLIEIERLENEQ